MNVIQYLQAQGISSRKGCQNLIRQGVVVINNKHISSVKEQINPDLVKSLLVSEERKYVIPMPYFCILINKPEGFEVSSKPRNYPSIFSLLPNQIRNLSIQAVGRLDIDTTGLLLITNDGSLNHHLTSPKHKVEKEYLIGLKYPLSIEQKNALLQGVLLNDSSEIVRAKNIKMKDDNNIAMVITSGKYHQVKRMIAAVGNHVISLHRTRLGQLEISEDLELGAWCFVDSNII